MLSLLGRSGGNSIFGSKFGHLLGHFLLDGGPPCECRHVLHLVPGVLPPDLIRSVHGIFPGGRLARPSMSLPLINLYPVLAAGIGQWGGHRVHDVRKKIGGGGDLLG